MKIEKNRLNQIIKYYVISTLVLTIFLPLMLSGFVLIQRHTRLFDQMANIEQTIRLTIEEKELEAKRIAHQLTADAAHQRALQEYFYESYSDYTTQFLMNGAKDPFLPNIIASQYRYDEQLSSIQIVLEDASDVYVSMLSNRYGRKQKQLQDVSGIILQETLRSPLTLQVLGQLFITYYLEEVIPVDVYHEAIQVVILGERGIEWSNVANDSTLAYFDEELSLDEIVSSLERQHYTVVNTIQSGHHIIIFSNKHILLSTMWQLLLAMMLFSLLTSGVVSYFLFRMLKQYAIQVDDILKSMKKIEKGQLYYRINENNKQAELRQMTRAINAMLTGQQSSLRQVYSLQMSQREATLKALQAQINPHFLYNTLEFIRMSVLVNGDDSLADFVYDFSSLMRHTIESTSEITIESELKFCRRYIHLYQARYPNKLEYEIYLDEALKQQKIPQFTIQPLIENYFVHGVDFSRCDNKLIIEVRLKDDKIELRVIDNGYGMPYEKITNINAQLQKMVLDPTRMDIYKEKRFGIMVVAQRLRILFGNKTVMQYEKNSQGGITVWINIPIKR